MKLRIASIKKSEFENSTLWEAKCSEVTEYDLAGKVVYARFTVEKAVGFEFEIDEKRIKVKTTKANRKVNVLV